MSNDFIIETKNLNKTYKGVHAVKDLNLKVYYEDIYGFLGPNGAGKSTTIRLLLSLIFPDSGEISIFNLSLNKNRNKILKRVGALIEKPDFYKYLSAYKNLELLAKLNRLSNPKKRIYEVLELVGLENRIESKVKTYSQGMKQRLGIAQAILHDPDLIILDEPGNGLDPQGTKDMRNLIQYLNKDLKKTILISSHLLHEIEMISNRMIIINRGSELVEGNVHDLLNAEKMNVTFEVDDSDKAVNLLKNHDEKLEFEIVSKRKIRVKIMKEKIPSINQLFVISRINVLSISPVRSLEEYFLNIT